MEKKPPEGLIDGRKVLNLTTEFHSFFWIYEFEKKKVSIIFFQSSDSPDCSFREDACGWETREGWALSKHSPDLDLQNYGMILLSSSRFHLIFVGWEVVLRFILYILSI